MILRLGLIAVYLMGLTHGLPALEKRFPTSSKGAVSPFLRPWLVLLRIWLPLFWVFPGVLWIGLLNLSALHIVWLSFLLPLCFLIIFLYIGGVFKFAGSLSNRLIAYVPVVPFVFIFTAVAIVLALAEPGVSYLRFAMFVSSAVIPALFSIALLVMWAPEVIPLRLDTEKRARHALAMILGYFTTMPKNVWMVEDGKIQKRIAGNPGGAGPALVITEPHNVVVLKKGLRISRVVGPGVVLLDLMEQPMKAVDLRSQIRSTRVSALTRDGVEVTVPISSMFRIKRGTEPVGLNQPWPYNSQRDVLEAIFAEEVDPTGRSALDERGAHPWEDLPLSVATHKVEQAVAFYTLDQLYSGVKDPEIAEKTNAPEAQLLRIHRAVEFAFRLPAENRLGDPLTRSTIGKLVRRAVMASVGRQGYEILGGGIGNVVAPVDPVVIDQQVARWQSHFVISVLEWQASLERQRFVALGKLQQGAREKLLNELVTRMSGYLSSTDDTTRDNFVAYYVLNSLLRIARDPEVRKMLPDSTLTTFEQLHEQFRADLGRPA